MNVSEGARTQTHPPASQKCDSLFLCLIWKTAGKKDKNPLRVWKHYSTVLFYDGSKFQNLRFGSSAAKIKETTIPTRLLARSPPHPTPEKWKGSLFFSFDTGFYHIYFLVQNTNSDVKHHQQKPESGMILNKKGMRHSVKCKDKGQIRRVYFSEQTQQRSYQQAG